MSKPVKRVWVVSDGIAGHFNQCKGLLQALELEYTLEVHWLEYRLRSGLLRRLLRYWLNRHAGNLSYAGLSACYRHFYLPHDAADLIIGAGGKSMYAVAAVAKMLNMPSVFVGSLRGLNPALFTAVLVLEQHPEPQYITVETAPMPVDPTQLQQAAQAWRAQHVAENGRLWAMLIGGDGAGAHYSAQDWQDLAEQMQKISDQHRVRWLLTTSRRSGAMAEQLLKRHLNPHIVADAVWWHSEPRKVMAAFLGCAEVVCCTAESLSMLTEAIVAQRPVLALHPAHFRPDERYANALHALENRRRLAVSAIVDSHLASSTVGRLQPMTQSPQQILLQQLQRQLAWSSS